MLDRVCCICLCCIVTIAILVLFGMVVRCLPVFSYICVNSFCVCIVFCLVVISFSKLHSITDIWVCGIIVDSGMNVGSLACVVAICVFMMLL